jgi:hypothetical protein
MFNANISDVNKLCFFSDVHGDMMALIINLRDCAKVIKKRDTFVFNQDTIDADLVRHMNVNMNNLFISPENQTKLDYTDPAIHAYFYKNGEEILPYDFAMNYEWVGGDSHVVLVGDLIDNVRFSNMTDIMPGEFIHEEIKIYRFLNALDDLAKQQGGRVIKLLGNHDFVNIINKQSYSRYQSTFAKDDSRNLHGINRKHFFSSKEGKDIIRYNGVGIILKINNYVCVHGSFTGLKHFIRNPKFNDLQKINDMLLSHIFDGVPLIDEYFNFLTLDKSGLLFDRSVGDDSFITDLYKNGLVKDWCSNTVITNLQELCKEDDFNCKENIKLVVGHCPQNAISNLGGISQGFKFASLDENVSQILSPELEQQSDHDSYHFGMSFSCTEDNAENPNPRLFRVDTGISRAFDQQDYINQNLTNNNIKTVYSYFKSKAPQVLLVQCMKLPLKDIVSLKRTTLSNMFTHQPRLSYLTQANIDKILIVEATRKQEAGTYLMKYLKYKSKYISLSNKIKH